MESSSTTQSDSRKRPRPDEHETGPDASTSHQEGSKKRRKTPPTEEIAKLDLNAASSSISGPTQKGLWQASSSALLYTPQELEQHRVSRGDSTAYNYQNETLTTNSTRPNPWTTRPTLQDVTRNSPNSASIPISRSSAPSRSQNMIPVSSPALPSQHLQTNNFNLELTPEPQHQRNAQVTPSPMNNNVAWKRESQMESIRHYFPSEPSTSYISSQDATTNGESPKQRQHQTRYTFCSMLSVVLVVCCFLSVVVACLVTTLYLHSNYEHGMEVLELRIKISESVHNEQRLRDLHREEIQHYTDEIQKLEWKVAGFRVQWERDLALLEA